jgi:hypothetical protein
MTDPGIVVILSQEMLNKLRKKSAEGTQLIIDRTGKARPLRKSPFLADSHLPYGQRDGQVVVGNIILLGFLARSVILFHQGFERISPVHSSKRRREEQNMKAFDGGIKTDKNIMNK